MVTNQQGYLPGYGWVWFLEHGIANILALKNVKKRYRVTYDSQNGKDFVVHKDDGGEPRRFKESEHGLYYMDTTTQGMPLVSTVKENKSRYTNTEYQRALLARNPQKRLGHASLRTTYLNIVDQQRLRNCPVTQGDTGALKGKTVRRQDENIRVPPHHGTLWGSNPQ